MTEVKNNVYLDERALFQAKDTKVTDCVFDVGESALKHSRDIYAEGVLFKGKYPVWYSNNVRGNKSTFCEGSRAALWYTDGLEISDTLYSSPKGIRRCNGVKLKNDTFTNAPETLWACKDIEIENTSVTGDYLCMNSENITIDGLTLEGKYSFDGTKNVVMRNSKIVGRDAFWNSENIRIENSYISGAYLGWNTKNMTLVNCTIESLQGMCYIENLVLKNCKLINTTLAFEYCTVDADIVSSIDSVINPTSGIIRAESIGELIMQPDMVDVSKTKIITQK